MSLTQVALSLREIELFDPSVGGLTIGQGRGEQRALCPLCGQGKPRDASHRSLSLNRSSGAWRCHRCGEGGKVKEMWEDRSSFSRRERMQRSLKQTFNLSDPVTSCNVTPCKPPVSSLDTPDNCAALNKGAPSIESWKCELRDLSSLKATQNDKRGVDYLCGRGLGAEEAHAARVRFCLRFMGRPALVFPLRDQSSQLRGAHARYVDGYDRPKARTLGDKRQSLFATPNAFNASLPAIIVTEAPLDALSLAQVGYPAVALCGTQPPTWLHRVCAFRRVLLAFDADEAGDRAADTQIPALESFGARCERLRPDGFKDWNDALRAGRDELADGLALRILSDQG